MQWLYRLNWWYDDLDKTAPVLRFFMFIIPMTIFAAMTADSDKPVSIAGFVGMALMAFIRITPFLFPRKRPL